MIKLETKVHVPAPIAVFTYGRQDTSDRSEVISRQASKFIWKRYIPVCNVWFARA